jgi:uncharacterized paraquat-inducible protein A
MWIALVALVLIALAGVVLMQRSRQQQAQRHVFRCPECGQKIRYAAVRAGADGACPRCWKRVTLPRTPQPLEANVPAGRYHRPLLGRPVRGVRGRR